MATVEDAIERIKELECPVGEVKNRVRGILMEYKVANGSEITVSRDHSLDKSGARGYRAHASRDSGLDIAVLTVSGMDDYVSQVIDAYIS